MTFLIETGEKIPQITSKSLGQMLASNCSRLSSKGFKAILFTCSVKKYL